MNYIDVSDLEPGQTFTHPVFIESDTIFVPAGVPIRDKDIKRLQDWQVERVETEGTAWATVAPQRALEEIWGLPTDGEFNVFYIQTVERMNHLFSRIRNNEEVAESEIDDIVQSIIQKVEDKEVDAVRLVLMSGNNSTDLGMSAVSIGLLSVSVGLTLKRPRHKLYHLCTGAILHDVGMQRIPQNLIALERGLRPHELKTLRTHPLHSYRIVSEELQLADEIAQIVLQHHERWDGKGYPQGRKGADIIYESRIISVADAFEAMVSERPWRHPMIGYDAMRAILSDNQRRFDPEIVKVFIRSVGLYPVGGLVLLSDGSIGRVMSASENAPLRPEVIILIDSAGEEFKDNSGQVVDLHTDKTLFIIRALGFDSLAQKTVPGSEK